MFVPIRFFFPSSFLAACVRSSAGRLIPVVWSSEGFIYDCLQQRQRQILRLARISLVPNPHNHLPHIFSACACSRRWEGEEEDDDGGRSSTHHSLSARGTHTQYIFSVKKSFVLTRLRLLIDAEQHKITIFRLRNYIYICLCVCAVMCVNEREFTSRLFVIIFDSKLLVRVRFFVPI